MENSTATCFWARRSLWVSNNVCCSKSKAKTYLDELPHPLAVFHYPQQRAFVYDRKTLKLIKAEVKFPKLTKSDYIRVIGGRIHLLAAAMIAEGRDENWLQWKFDVTLLFINLVNYILNITHLTY